MARPSIVVFRAEVCDAEISRPYRAERTRVTGPSPDLCGGMCPRVTLWDGHADHDVSNVNIVISIRFGVFGDGRLSMFPDARSLVWNRS
jgi:hypothetical protein